MASFKEKIFDVAPLWFKELGLGVNSYLTKSRKYGNIYKDSIDELRKNYKLSAKDILVKQEDYLREFLIFLYNNNTYYMNIFINLDIRLENIEENPRACLVKLPLMEKSYFKENLAVLTTSNLDTEIFSNTSGTSGSPMTIPVDSVGYQLGFAYWRRFYDIMGLPGKFVNVRFSGRVFVPEKERNIFWLFDKFENRYFFSTYHLHEKNMQLYINKLNKIMPELIDGYPSAITLIAKYILNKKITLKFTPKAIAVTAETLSQQDRLTIEKAFKAKVYNQYASSEGAPFITECTHGRFHLNLDTGIFEFKDIDKENNNLKELIVTSFRNRKVPLVRYRIKDTVKLADSARGCGCGCHFPLVDSIEGRLDDLVYSTERGAVGRLDPVYKGVNGIEASQIIQIGLDDFIIKVKPSISWNAKEKTKLENNFLNRLGASVCVSVELVDEISLGANGKFKSVINNYRSKH